MFGQTGRQPRRFLLKILSGTRALGEIWSTTKTYQKNLAVLQLILAFGIDLLD